MKMGRKRHRIFCEITNQANQCVSPLRNICMKTNHFKATALSIALLSGVAQAEEFTAKINLVADSNGIPVDEYGDHRPGVILNNGKKITASSTSKGQDFFVSYDFKTNVAILEVNGGKHQFRIVEENNGKASISVNDNKSELHVQIKDDFTDIKKTGVRLIGGSFFKVNKAPN